MNGMNTIKDSRRMYETTWLERGSDTLQVRSTRARSAPPPTVPESDCEYVPRILYSPRDRGSAIQYQLIMKSELDRLFYPEKCATSESMCSDYQRWAMKNSKSLSLPLRWPKKRQYGQSSNDYGDFSSDLMSDENLPVKWDSRSDFDLTDEEVFPMDAEPIKDAAVPNDEYVPMRLSQLGDLHEYPSLPMFTLVSNTPIMRPAFSSFASLDHSHVNTLKTVDSMKVIFENSKTVVKLAAGTPMLFDIQSASDVKPLEKIFPEKDITEEGAIRKKRKISPGINFQHSNVPSDSESSAPFFSENHDEVESLRFEEVRDTSVSYLLPYLLRFYRRAIIDPKLDQRTKYSSVESSDYKKRESHHLFAFWTKLFSDCPPETDEENSNCIFISNTSFQSLKKIDREQQTDHALTYEVLQNLELNLKLFSAKTLKSQSLTYQKKNSVLLGDRKAGVWTVEEQLEIPPESEYSEIGFPTLSLIVSYNINSHDSGYIKIVTKCYQPGTTIQLMCEIGETEGTDQFEEIRGSRSDLYLDEPLTNRLMNYFARFLRNDRFTIVTSPNGRGKACVLIDASQELSAFLNEEMPFFDFFSPGAFFSNRLSVELTGLSVRDSGYAPDGESEAETALGSERKETSETKKKKRMGKMRTQKNDVS